MQPYRSQGAGTGVQQALVQSSPFAGALEVLLLLLLPCTV
jgi:hypothetical protein